MDDKVEQQIETEKRAILKQVSDDIVREGVPYHARTGAERDRLARLLAEQLVVAELRQKAREQGRKEVGA